MLGIGWCASKKNTDSEYCYLGGRKLGPLVAALSASASSSSAWSLLGVSGAAVVLAYVWLGGQPTRSSGPRPRIA
jgi:Na+/proline symporter